MRAGKKRLLPPHADPFRLRHHPLAKLLPTVSGPCRKRRPSDAGGNAGLLLGTAELCCASPGRVVNAGLLEPWRQITMARLLFFFPGRVRAFRSLAVYFGSAVRSRNVGEPQARPTPTAETIYAGMLCGHHSTRWPRPRGKAGWDGQSATATRSAGAACASPPAQTAPSRFHPSGAAVLSPYKSSSPKASKSVRDGSWR
jgi:hypothetical protein